MHKTIFVTLFSLNNKVLSTVDTIHTIQYVALQCSVYSTVDDIDPTQYVTFYHRLQYAIYSTVDIHTTQYVTLYYRLQHVIYSTVDGIDPK